MSTEADHSVPINDEISNILLMSEATTGHQTQNLITSNVGIDEIDIKNHTRKSKSSDPTITTRKNKITYQNEDEIKKDWKIGSDLQLYSKSLGKWFAGKITNIIMDNHAEWLTVKYDKSREKEVQRFDDTVKPTEKQLIRKSWKTGSSLQLYSRSLGKWFAGEIIKITKDDHGEWLEVVYDKSRRKEVQRLDTSVKPTQKQLMK